MTPETPELTEQDAADRDARDALPTLREQFHVPAGRGGRHAEAAYLVGNSLGLQPRTVQAIVDGELADWATLGVEGHFYGRRPWASYPALMRDASARIVGALPSEVVMMNTLTVNLHMMMVSFYRPTPERHAILIEDTAFPSDSYAVRSQAAFHGFDPDEAVIRLHPREGEAGLRNEDVVEFLAREGHRVAMVLLGAVNYYSGEFLDIPAITAAGRAAGAVVGWDLAHAAGNVELRLHDWDVDWAAWCTYKYLNSGPGALAGAFVHEKHLGDRTLPKFAGWWSTDPAVRFEMAPTVTPMDLADSWQVSNPSVFAAAPVLASLAMFDAVGMQALRAKSIRLTCYLEACLDEAVGGRAFDVITPRDPQRRGAQLSVRLLHGVDAATVQARLRDDHGVFTDSRKPDVIRMAPVPMYCTYHDCWRAANALAEVLDSLR